MPKIPHAIILRAGRGDSAAATTLGGRKFFVGVGFHRPHIPWFVPQAKLDLYPRESIALPEHPEPPAGMPPVAW